MSLSAVGRVGSSAPFHVPVRTAPGSWSPGTEVVAAYVRVIPPLQGSAAFLAQHLAQEVLDGGVEVPRWRERAAAYAPAAPARRLDLTA